MGQLAPEQATDTDNVLKVMGNRVSKCLRQERVQQTGQLDPCETPRGNHVVRVTLLPISMLTEHISASMPTELMILKAMVLPMLISEIAAEKKKEKMMALTGSCSRGWT
jgi:hypothetical protein